MCSGRQRLSEARSVSMARTASQVPAGPPVEVTMGGGSWRLVLLRFAQARQTSSNHAWTVWSRSRALLLLASRRPEKRQGAPWKREPQPQAQAQWWELPSLEPRRTSSSHACWVSPSPLYPGRSPRMWRPALGLKRWAHRPLWRARSRTASASLAAFWRHERDHERRRDGRWPASRQLGPP